MNIKCNRAALHDALQLASSIVPVRTPKPILQCARFQVDSKEQSLTITATNNEITIRYVIPQRISKPGLVSFSLRVEKPQEASILRVKADGKEIFKKKLPWVNPANMVEFNFDITADIVNSEKNLEVALDD